MRVCIVGASGKLGRYMVEHALDRGHEVVAVCREQSVGKLAEFGDRIMIVPGATDDRDVIKRAVAGCDGVLVVLVPRGMHRYSSGTAQAVLDHAQPGPARLESPRGRPGPEERHYAPRGLRSVHGGGARQRRSRSRGPPQSSAARAPRRWRTRRPEGLDAPSGKCGGMARRYEEHQMSTVAACRAARATCARGRRAARGSPPPPRAARPAELISGGGASRATRRVPWRPWRAGCRRRPRVPAPPRRSRC
jgi:hypothetical protein